MSNSSKTYDMESLLKLADAIGGGWRKWPEEKPELLQDILVSDNLESKYSTCFLGCMKFRDGSYYLVPSLAWVMGIDYEADEVPEKGGVYYWLPLSPLLEFLEGVGK